MEGPLGSKVIGNGLRELDRFLSVLLDEAARSAGIGKSDLRRLAGLRNTANKLDAVRAYLGGEASDGARLRALGRCRDTLFYCNGVVRRGDRGLTTMLTGWPAATGGDGTGQAVAVGQRLPISPRDIAWICRFYDRIADELIGDIRSSASADRPRTAPHHCYSGQKRPYRAG